jgi:hypothetical protein
LAHRLYAEEKGAGRPAEPAPFRLRRWLPLAAAAVLVVGIGLGALHLLTRQTSAPAYRSQEDRWIESEVSPNQPLPRAECVLRWTAGPEGTTYDLTLTTGDLEPLARVWRLERSEYRVDPGVLKDVPSGETVLWRVTAHLPDGRVVSSRTFSTRVE